MDQEPQVIKEASCPSLSTASIINYQFGNTPDGTIHIRLTGNSGNGYFNGYWVPMPTILNLLNDQDEPFIWSALCPLFEGRSVNSACFLMAVLLAEEVVQPSKVMPRRYEMTDTPLSMVKIQAMPITKEKTPKKGAKKPPSEPTPEVDPPADPATNPVEPTEEA